MNNVETARLISYVAVLDAVPQAIEYTIIDQTALRDGIDLQLTRDLSAVPWLRDGLLEARSTFDRQLALLEPLDEMFDASGGYDLTQMTYYRPPGAPEGGRGDLWQAIDALSGMSVAAMENLTPLSGLNATQAARANQQIGRGGGGVLMAWDPDVPWVQGDFGDFRLPVLRGRLPAGQDDPQTNRGPFDTLFGFRDYRLGGGGAPLPAGGDLGVVKPYALTEWVPASPEALLPRRGAEIISYDTYGAYRDMRTRGMDLARSPYGHTSPYQEAWADPARFQRHPLAPSLWARHLAFIADRKINFCFPGAASNRVVLRPRWEQNYDEATEIQAAGLPAISNGLYLVLNFIRDEFEGDLLSITAPPLLDTWGIARPEREVLSPPHLLKVAEHVWRDEKVVKRETIDGRGYHRRHLRYFVFIGVQIAEEAAVRNPFNFDAEDRKVMAGPINFPPEYGAGKGFAPNDVGQNDRGLTYLGIAYQPKDAPMWSSAFDDDRRDRHQVALAQAVVFNNHSWDLWTQMWHAQLTPVDRYGDWLSILDEVNDPDPALAEVRSYLHAVEPLIELMTTPVPPN
ncbi:MAG: hypothetical protein AAF333_09575 [Planctomycetota bacterium]